MKTDTLEKIALQLLNQNSMKAVEILNNEYPFTFLDRSKRTYTETVNQHRRSVIITCR